MEPERAAVVGVYLNFPDIETADRIAAALVERVAELHPYEIPCVVAYPAVGGASPYLDWVRGETAGCA